MTRIHVPLALLVGALLGVAVLLAPRPSLAQTGGFELEVMRLVNQERAERGLGPLGSDVRLFRAAEDHSAWMCSVQRLSHTGSGGSTPGHRITAAGYAWTSYGETVARGFTTPASVVAGFRGSPPHWSILMSSRYRDIGVGYVECGGRSYRHFWTIDVASSRSAATPVGGGDPAPSATPRPVEPSATPRPIEPSATPRPSSTSTPRPSSTPPPTSTPRPVEPSATPRPTATDRPSAPGDGTVRGVVLLQGVAPLAGTQILMDGRAKTLTDDAGRFMITGVPGGLHRFTARRAGWLDASHSLLVAGGTDLGTALLLAGDVVVDNEVVYGDFRALFAAWGACRGNDRFVARADYDGDGCLSFGDYGVMRPNYRISGPTAWSPSP